MRRSPAAWCLVLGLACGPSPTPPEGTEGSSGSTAASSETAADGASETGGLPPTSTGSSMDSSGGSSPMTTTGLDDTGSSSSGTEPMTDACQSEIDQCNNGEDDDGDGLVDMADPECLSPCDNTEGELGSMFVGDNVDCLVDCAFDSTFGSGDDDCLADVSCDPEMPGKETFCINPPPPMCPGPASQQCVDVCLPRTPNGCDCYGCCAFDVGGMATFLYVGLHSWCDQEDLAACYACTPDMSCFDPCDQPCEVCVGSTTPPPGCNQADCDAGEQPCTIDAQGQHDCPDGFYCVTGCCHPDP